MAKSRIPLGNEAIGSALTKNVHSSTQVQSKFPNANAGIKFERAFALRLDDFYLYGKQQLYIVFTHNDIPGVELHEMKCFLR